MALRAFTLLLNDGELQDGDGFLVWTFEKASDQSAASFQLCYPCK